MRVIGKRTKPGFTLVELLIAIAIIAVLVAVAVPALLKSERAGKEGAAMQTIKSLQSAEEQFRTSQVATAGVSKTYGTLDDLKTKGLSLFGEGEAEAESGYTFVSKGMPSDHDYTILAVPPSDSEMRGFTLTADGVVASSL